MQLSDFNILICVNSFFIITFFIYYIFYRKKQHEDLKNRIISNPILSVFQNYWFTITEPVVMVFIKLKVNPNLLTFVGLLLNVIAGFLLAKQMWGIGGWIFICASVFDLFDGRVARATNKVSINGGYLDSVTDRFSEGAIMTGFIYAFRNHWMLVPVILSFVFSYTVSFARAKCEADGASCKEGAFQRSERIIVLSIGTVFTDIVSKFLEVEQPVLLYLTIFILLFGNLFTSIYRINLAYNKLKNIYQK